ncbi:hypothetical protein EV182_000390 [Spiromyces aspiralis]|uniref:Uncharacterized protein n=1 Tax=Spiromyces aspiralis TaxID=68401 RepID=A0ACC1HL38_9FUNG|nr:hypothetical protein EV182_000390 [Spiromyces aspiralis]
MAWACYDTLKLAGYLHLIPFETWRLLFKTCQVDYSRQTHDGAGHTAILSGSARENPIRIPWSWDVAKVRCQMFLRDMWACALNSPDRSTQFHPMTPANDPTPLESAMTSSTYEAPLPPHHPKLGTYQDTKRPTSYHYNILLNVLGKGKPGESTWHQVDEALQHMRLNSIAEDIFTYNTLFGIAIRTGQWRRFHDILETVRELDEWGVIRMDTVTAGSIVNGLRIFKHERELLLWIDWVGNCIKMWHEKTSSSDDDNNGQDFVASEDDTDNGVGTRKRALEPTEPLVNTIIHVLLQRGRISEALQWKNDMKEWGLGPSGQTYSIFFAELRQRRRRLRWRRRGDKRVAELVELGHSLFQEMVSLGVEPNTICLTNIVGLICMDSASSGEAVVSAGNVASQVLQKLETRASAERNALSYAMLLNHYAARRDADSAQALWSTIQADARDSSASPGLIQPVTLNAYFNALHSGGKHQQVFDTFAAIPGARSHLFEIVRGLDRPSWDEEGGGDSALSSLHGSATRRSPVGMMQVGRFEKLVDRHTFNTVIASCAVLGQHERSLGLLDLMVDLGHVPTVATMYALLGLADGTPPNLSRNLRHVSNCDKNVYAVAKLGLSRIVQARRELARRRQRRRQQGRISMTREGAAGSSRTQDDEETLKALVEPAITTPLANQLIAVAGRAWDKQFAKQVFDQLNVEHAALMAQLQRGKTGQDQLGQVDDDYASQRSLARGEDPPDQEEDYLPYECAPNVYTYTSLLYVYARLGRLQTVLSVWKEMIGTGITPNIASYTSLLLALHRVVKKYWRQQQQGQYRDLDNWYGWQLDDGEQRPGSQPPLLSSSNELQLRRLGEEGDEDDIFIRATQKRVANLIHRIEDFLIGTTTTAVAEPTTSGSSASAPEDHQQQWWSWAGSNGDEDIQIDLPAATLLLHTHTVNIQQQKSSPRALEREVQRALQVCNILEKLHIEPDKTFYEALLALFESYGDERGIAIVKEMLDKHASTLRKNWPVPVA